MNSLRFEKAQLRYLALILKCKPSEIVEVTGRIKDFYSEYHIDKIDRKSGKNKTYKDGTVKKREVAPPLHLLKKLQTGIKQTILDQVKFGGHVQGGVKGKSNISNAKIHQGKKFVFTTDLRDFFPSVSYKMVYAIFLSLGYSHHLARWFTRLTTFRRGLPQGAPTSSHLANLAFQQCDKQLLALCEMHKITYTRFIDDLTFSSPGDFKNQINQILEIIKIGGFEINYRKTNYSRNQIITGIAVFNNYIDAPDHIKSKAEIENKTSSSFKPFNIYLNQIHKTNSKS